MNRHLVRQQVAIIRKGAVAEYRKIVAWAYRKKNGGSKDTFPESITSDAKSKRSFAGEVALFPKTDIVPRRGILYATYSGCAGKMCYIARLIGIMGKTMKLTAAKFRNKM